MPSGSPLNVICIATGSRTAEVSWSEPTHVDQNGPIIYYLIKLVDLWYGTGSMELNTTTSTNFTIVSQLEEYAQYTCQVAAATSAGVGPQSEAIIFTTFQDCKCNYKSFTTSCCKK